MAELTVGARTFIIGRMPPMTQLHVMRRYNKVALAMAQARAFAPNFVGEAPTQDELDTQNAIIGNAMMNAFGELSETDVNYIFAVCLSHIQLKQDSGTLAPLWVGGQTGSLAFQDLDMATLVQLVHATVEENLRPIMTGNP